MEVKSRDGGREQTGSSSSSSGTIVSTTYSWTSSGSCSHLSSSSMDAAAMHLTLGLELHDADDNVSQGETEEAKMQRIRETEEAKMQRIRSLVREFVAASSSVNCSVRGGGIGGPVVGSWLRELGVGWVLHLPSSASARTSDAAGTCSWIRALREIVDTIGLTESLFPDQVPVEVDMDMTSIFEEQEQEASEETEAVSSVPDSQFQFARLIQETMLKMLSFVDILVAIAIDPNGNNVVSALYQKLNVLVPVRGALFEALSEMGEVSFLPEPCQEPCQEVERLLRAKDVNARDAIWSTIEQIRTLILLEGIQTPHGTSGIHKATHSVMGHINFLLNNYTTLHPIVSEAASLGKYVPQIGGQPHLDSMAMEIMSCLEEKLAIISESFSDQGLRFLFLLNNSEFMRGKLENYTLNSSIKARVAVLSSEVERYIERYLQVSWTPLLSCLLNPTPLCLFGKYYYPSALPKFESAFEKAAPSQHLWKVPDPELRTRLRTAITDRIIPVYTKYVEDNKTTNTKYTPQELEEMLQELFEG